MSYVYLAWEELLHRWVAVKVLAPHLAEEPDVVDRFLREARTQARLNHPNIVNIHGVSRGEPEDLHYIVMEYMPGRTLGDVLRAPEPLDPRVARVWLTQVGSALAHAHDHDIVHRDVKPENILFDRRGDAHVADFGIARLDNLPRLTQVGMVMGTPTYMSPEQFDAEAELGPASDQYSLGVLAYHMLAGVPPFSGGDLELYRAHREEEPAPPQELRPSLDPALGEAVLRMLAKEPAGRFPTVGEAVSALGPLVPGPGDPLGRAMAHLAAAPARLQIDVPEEVTLRTGERKSLPAVVCDDAGQPLPDRPVEWRSTDPDVVGVTPEGLLVGLREGVARVTAVCEGVEAERSVTVVADRAGAGASPEPAGASGGEASPSEGAVSSGADAAPETPDPGVEARPGGPGEPAPSRGPASRGSGGGPAASPGTDPGGGRSEAAGRRREAPSDPSGPRAPSRRGEPTAVPADPADGAGETGSGSSGRRSLVAPLLGLVGLAGVAVFWLLLGGGGGPAAGTLVVEGSLPAGAEVVVEGGGARRTVAVGEPVELPAGEYVVLASAGGFDPVRTTVTVAAGEDRRLPVRMAPSAPTGPAGAPAEELARVVVDPAGLPAGARVVLARGDSTVPVPASGEVEVPPGSWSLRVAAPGFAPSDTLLELAAGTVAVTPAAGPPDEAPPSGTAAGRVLLADAPPPGARVTVTGEDGSARPLGAGGGVGLPPGRYVVRASAPGFESVRRTVTVRPGEDTRVALAMEPAAPAGPPEGEDEGPPPPPAEGTLRLQGTPLPGTRLSLEGGGASRDVEVGVVPLAPGEYVLNVEAPGREGASVPVVVRAGEETELRLPELPLAGDLAGAARDVVREVVARFDRRDATVADLLDGQDRDQYRMLLENTRAVPELSAELVRVSDEPTLTGGTLRVPFLMRLSFFNNNVERTSELEMVARLQEEGGAWSPVALDLEAVR
jgi:hypothetical protein